MQPGYRLSACHSICTAQLQLYSLLAEVRRYKDTQLCHKFSYHEINFEKKVNIFCWASKHIARSLCPKFDELCVVCDLERPDIVCVTETWLCEDNSLFEFNIAGYNQWRI